MNALYSHTAIDIIGESLTENDIASLRVIGNSMYPLLKNGDIVLVQVGSSNLWWRGEIVVFNRGGESITHRLIKDNGERILTKGDNTIIADESVAKQSVLGRIISIKHGGKEYPLNTKRARFIAAMIGQIGFIQVKSISAIAEIWAILFKDSSLGIKIILTRVISYPFRAAIRVVSIFT